MLIPPKALNVSGCASKDPTRYQLVGVFIERHEGKCSATATDGKVLARAEWAEDPPADFPEISGVNPLAKEGTHVLIPLSEVKAIQKLAPRKPRIPILENVAMDEHALNGTATFAGTDLDVRNRAEIRTMDAHYPDASKAVHDAYAGIKLHVNPQVLLKALETLIACLPKCDCATLEIANNGSESQWKALRFRANDDPLEVTTLAMPLIVKEGGAA